MNLPCEFHADTTSLSGIDTKWTSTSGGFRSELAIPPEFDGPGGGLSPEDLFNQALSNCFIATFKVYAHHSKLSYERIRAESSLVVDYGDTGKPIMKSLRLNVTISSPSHPDRAMQIAKKAAASGFIINSVKTALDVQISIT